MLLGRRVRLRAIEREDLATFLRWFNDPEVRRYLLMYEPMSMAKDERFAGRVR
jgi:RimJ/RimL family protein N-acetyltransferase